MQRIDQVGAVDVVGKGRGRQQGDGQGKSDGTQLHGKPPGRSVRSLPRCGCGFLSRNLAYLIDPAALTGRLTKPIFNPMVNYQPAVLDRTFAALADPTRRALLARLDEEASLSVSELARPFPVSLPAIMKHLDVLSDAGLITRSKTGRTVTCQLTPAPMEQAMEWLARYERYWTEQLDRLAAFLENDQWQPNPPSSSSDDSKPRRKRSTKRGPSRSK
ncbi:MAG TPA: helix-turn-helix transcriptional regulator [Reyranella sp.]